MAQNIVDQNKNFSSAAGKPRDTSSRKANANTYSARIASSSNNSRSAMKESKVELTKEASSPIGGSFEGLQNSSGTLINMNNTGYSKKSLQTARYNKKQIDHNDHMFLKNDFKPSSNYGIMDNYSSFTMRGTSSDRLGKIVKNNMMFG